ncbi:MAG: hypothetical protein NXY57DRAFT_970235 [Lentinula lateritia]|nr:MAG: hypothetical protein NXY57DRAFT_970235 [Lentinula lateritia]
MVNAFMVWSLNEEQGCRTPEEIEGALSISMTMVDVFDTTKRLILLIDGGYQLASMVRAGVFPSSPLRHNHAFSTHTLHLFHDLFCRCPRLSIQPFIKSLCDVQGLPFKPYLMQQFSSAYDAYLEVRSRIQKLVAQALGQDSPTWRILHACPCCQNELEEDDPLEIRMMVAMDGNDSLKRVECCKDAAEDSLAEVAGSGVVERMDPRQAGSNYFISRVLVNEWVEGNWKNALVSVPQDSFRDWVWKTGRCEEKWHNASDKNTGKSWAKFDENGIFLLICRHSLVLSLSDMVKSERSTP